MKIQNNLPIRAKRPAKPGQSRSDGVFQALFEADIAAVQAADEQPMSDDRTGAKAAWRALEDSVSLLDQAMLCLESGDAPTQQLVDNIEQLRATLHQQLTSASNARALTQAEILLAVEVERIRSFQP